MAIKFAGFKIGLSSQYGKKIKPTCFIALKKKWPAKGKPACIGIGLTFYNKKK